MSRARACWSGKIRALGQSPFTNAPVIALTVEVTAEGQSPDDQFGRLIQVDLSPALARRLGDRLHAQAARAEVGISKELG